MRTTPPRLRTQSRWLSRLQRSVRADETSTHVVLHTVQHPAVWADLTRLGTYEPSRWLADHDFADGYAWMHQQMADRLPTRSEGILWLWAQRQRRVLRVERPGAGHVLLTCRVPRQNVLISHFADWHCVLNRSPLIATVPGETQEEYGRRLDLILDDFYDRCDAVGVTNAPLTTWPVSLREELETTWTGVFDPAQWSTGATLQATAHSLSIEHVLRAVHLR